MCGFFIPFFFPSWVEAVKRIIKKTRYNRKLDDERCMKCIHRVNEMTTNKNWRQNNKNLHRSILHAFSYCIVFTHLSIFTASKGMYAKTYMPNVSKKTSMQRKKIVNVFIPDDSTILHIQTTLNYSP